MDGGGESCQVVRFGDTERTQAPVPDFPEKQAETETEVSCWLSQRWLVAKVHKENPFQSVFYK